MPELHRKATWNPVRDLWETDQTVLLSEHSAAYSETLPPSGMTRSGVLFERLTLGRRTNVPECLSLPTPRASEGEKGGPNQKGSSGDLTLSSATVRMLPTPTANLGENGGSQDPTKRRAGGHSVSLQDVAEYDLLPTPMVGSTSPAAHGQISGDFSRRMDEALAQFGRFAPAIRRWEQVTGHPAPPPTDPTGRGGAHRLSARFAEWMMGLEPGWVTDIPISRTEQLRAIGNGVVPRQAVAALVDMKQHFEPRPVRGSSTHEEDK